MVRGRSEGGQQMEWCVVGVGVGNRWNGAW